MTNLFNLTSDVPFSACGAFLAPNENWRTDRCPMTTWSRVEAAFHLAHGRRKLATGAGSSPPPACFFEWGDSEADGLCPALARVGAAYNLKLLFLNDQFTMYISIMLRGGAAFSLPDKGSSRRFG